MLEENDTIDLKTQPTHGQPSEGHLIHCFKEGQPCANGLDMLKDQQNLLPNAEYLNSNPFEITESDKEEANMNNNFIDPSDSEDDLIDTEL